MKLSTCLFSTNPSIHIDVYILLVVYNKLTIYFKDIIHNSVKDIEIKKRKDNLVLQQLSNFLDYLTTFFLFVSLTNKLDVDWLA